MNSDEPLPWYSQRTFWTSAVGIVTGLGGILAVFIPGKATEVGVIVAAVAAIAGNLGSIFARSGAKADAVKVSTTLLNEHAAATGAPSIPPESIQAANQG